MSMHAYVAAVGRVFRLHIDGPNSPPAFPFLGAPVPCNSWISIWCRREHILHSRGTGQPSISSRFGASISDAASPTPLTRYHPNPSPAASSLQQGASLRLRAPQQPSAVTSAEASPASFPSVSYHPRETHRTASPTRTALPPRWPLQPRLRRPLPSATTTTDHALPRQSQGHLPPQQELGRLFRLLVIVFLRTMAQQRLQTRRTHAQTEIPQTTHQRTQGASGILQLLRCVEATEPSERVFANGYAGAK